MASANTDDLQDQIQLIRQRVNEESVELTLKLSAWWYFLHWISSYTPRLEISNGHSDIVLTEKQTSEFAFYYDEKLGSDNFVLLAQESNYSWLNDIGISCAVIEDDGLVIVIDELNQFDTYISSFAIKLRFAANTMNKLKVAKKSADKLRLASMVSVKSAYSGKKKWNIKLLSHKVFQIVEKPSDVKDKKSLKNGTAL
jgi:hypothetical protein